MKLFLLIASMLLPQAPAAQTGAVTGVVVVSGSAQGIPDADILITSGTQKWDAVSDANGKFTLNNIPAGRHTLNIQADGYYAAVTGNSPTGPLVSMPVTAGQTVTVSMVRGGVISGKVVDTAGRPLIAAEVAAFKINEGTNRSVSNFEPVASRITDDRGEYRLFWLAPGEYFIAAVPRPQIDMTAARTGAPVAIQTIPTFFPNAAEVSGATKVAVKSGEEVRGIDVSARTDIPTERKITSVKVSGQITNALFPGPTGGALSVTRKDFDSGVLQIGNVLLNGATVPFEIPALPPGNYDLYVRVEDPRGTPGRGGVVSAWGRASLELRDHDVTDVRMTVHPSVEVSGVLQVDGKTPPTGGPMKITLIPSGTLTRLPSYTGVTDRAPTPGADGTFSISAVPDGNFRVDVSGLSPSSYVSDVRQGEASIFGKGLDVGDTKPTKVEVFVKSDGGSVEGVVKTTEPATVALVPEDREMMRLARYVTTAADGKFSFKGVRPGEYKVLAVLGSSNLPLTDPRNSSRVEGKGVAVTVKPSSTVTANVTVITD